MGLRSFDVFYQFMEEDEWTTYRSSYQVYDDELIGMGLDERYAEKMTYERMEMVKVIGEIHGIHKDSNTLWIDGVVDEVRTLSCYNLNYEWIMSVELPLSYEDRDLILSDVMFREQEGELGIGLIISHGNSYIAVEMAYENMGDATHILGCGDCYFVNGVPVSERNYVYDHTIDVVTLEDKTYIESSNHIVLLPVFEASDYYNLQFGQVILFDETLNHLASLNMQGERTDEVFEYESTIYGGNVKSFADGVRMAYIEGYSYDLIITDGEGNLLERVDVPKYMLKHLMFDEQNSEYTWETIDNGVAFVTEDETSFSYQKDFGYYYHVAQNRFYDIDCPIKGYLQLGDEAVYVSNTYNYVLNTEDMTFYIQHDKMTQYPREFSYDGVYYYINERGVNDEPVELSEEIVESDDFKPLDEAPMLDYNNARLQMINSQGEVGYQCVQLEGTEGIGYELNGAYVPITENDVRTFDSNAYGVVYSGYGDQANGYFFHWDSQQLYTLELDVAANDILMMEDYIYILSEGYLLSMYSVERLIAENLWRSEKELDLTTLPEFNSIPNFRIDANNEYLVAYTINYAYDLEQPALTYVLDSQLNPLQRFTGFYEGLLEEQVLLDYYYYLVRADIVTGRQQAIVYDTFAGVSGTFGDKGMINNSYESPGETWFVDKETPAVDVLTAQQDPVNEDDVAEQDLQTILVFISHQNGLLLIDGRAESFENLGTIWRMGDIWIEDHVLYVEDGNRLRRFELEDGEYKIVYGPKAY
jgi:hypothetical protein